VRLTTHLHLVLRSKNAWIYTSTSPYVFMSWCLVKPRDYLYLTSSIGHNPIRLYVTYEIEKASLNNARERNIKPDVRLYSNVAITVNHWLGGI